VRTNKQTDAAENIHLAPLCYAGGYKVTTTNTYRQHNGMTARWESASCLFVQTLETTKSNTGNTRKQYNRNNQAKSTYDKPTDMANYNKNK